MTSRAETARTPKSTSRARPADGVPILVTPPAYRARRHFPLKFVLMGVLGDLALTRVNAEVMQYCSSDKLRKIDDIYMCDTEPAYNGSDAGQYQFLFRLYRRCLNYRCTAAYFSAAFLKKTESITPDSSGELSAPEVEDILKSMGSDVGLTTLGHFLVNHYHPTATEHDRFALFSSASPEADWVFYLAIPPSAYRTIIDSIVAGFYDGNKSADGARVVLLEKPLQESFSEAQELASHIERLNAKHKSLHIFAVDHYMAKSTLTELPALLVNHPDFKRFVTESNEILIELIEPKTVPDYRMNYFGKTGLLFDMAGHCLVPLQLLYAGQTVTYRVELVAVGCYRGYKRQFKQWVNNQDGNREIRPETYFSIRLKLHVSDPARPEAPTREVTAHVRSGKAMNLERKRVIIKRESEHGGPNGNVEIDILAGKFTADDRAGVTLPPNIKGEGTVAGYARILLVVIDFLNGLDELSGGDPTQTLRRSGLYSVQEAASVIGNIEEMKRHMKSWPNTLDYCSDYPESSQYVMREKEEGVFLRPYE